jgi:hypothetical protein
MTNSRRPVLQKIRWGCSRLLLLVGAVVFCVGGKFIYEIKHVSFLISEAIGIFGGVLLMLIGAGLAMKKKSPRLE